MLRFLGFWIAVLGFESASLESMDYASQRLAQSLFPNKDLCVFFYSVSGSGEYSVFLTDKTAENKVVDSVCNEEIGSEA